MSAPDIAISAEQMTAAVTDGERKSVTALFADIRGSTELMEDLDPEEARAIIDPALKLMIDAVRRYDGYIVQSTGDGIFALFGAPLAHEDHPQRALYAAVRMQEELHRYSARIVAAGGIPIQCRVGAHTGEVVVRSITTGEAHTEYAPIGHTTNLASRMQAVAPVGSIAVSETTRRWCEGYFAFKSLGPTKLRGVSDPIDVHEVTGLGPLRTRLQRAVGRGLTTFVGREREMDALRHAAEQAKTGHGQIVAVMAEPGVGKSRLFFEFKTTSQSGWRVLETFSISHGKASAYLPIIELLHGYFAIEPGDDGRKRREKVSGRLLALDRSLEGTLPYLFNLLGIVQGDDPLAQMDGRLKKQRTLEAIKRILLRESLNQPLMVVSEDLHWIDHATQECLNLLADSIGTAKILLLVNYRPEYSHQWNSKTYYTQLRLDPLLKDSAEEMLAVLLGPGDDLAEIKRLIIERTEGNPLFMEEMVLALLDERALILNGVGKVARPWTEMKIPPSVQAIIAARVDRLPADDKDLLQTLAVIGKEFSLSLVRAVTGRAKDELAQIINELQLAEFIYEQPAISDLQYTFKHALTQEVAYNSLLSERRKLLHERAGEALELMFADQLDDHLGELAHHYSHSTNAAKALRYLVRAGQQALTRSAFAEAQEQLTRGLEWIKENAESSERNALHLELMGTLAQVLLLTKGSTAPETRAATERARDLAEKDGNLAQLLIQVFGIWRGLSASGQHSTAAQLADRLLDLAEREGSAVSFGFVCRAKLDTSFFRGDLADVEMYLARWSDSLNDDGFRKIPGAAAPAIALTSICAWTLGHTDLARERIARGIAFARDNNNPYDLGTVRIFESGLYCFLREPDRTYAAAAQGLALAEEYSMLLVRNMISTMLGWAQAHRGRASEGVALIQQGLEGLAEAGIRLNIVDNLTRLAQAQALDGKIDDALITIDEALDANPEERVCRPNALTFRGELRLKIGRTKSAESDFREAIILAQTMQAKAWELRATTSLAHLLRDSGRRHEAHTMLAEIYGWFTEGLDTADLKNAEQLLDELGP